MKSMLILGMLSVLLIAGCAQQNENPGLSSDNKFIGTWKTVITSEDSIWKTFPTSDDSEVEYYFTFYDNNTLITRQLWSPSGKEVIYSSIYEVVDQKTIKTKIITSYGGSFYDNSYRFIDENTLEWDDDIGRWNFTRQ
jgi:hypothetical protein